MKFSVDDTKKSFALALKRANDLSPKAYNKGVFNPALACIRIEATETGALKVMGTDMYSYIVSYAHADVVEAGEVIVDSEITSNFVFSKPGEMEGHSTKKNLILVTPNKSRVQVNLYEGKGGLPETPRIPVGKQKYEIKGSVLNKLLNVRSMAQTKFNASGYFTGVLLQMDGERIYSCATNTYCFGLSWFPYKTKEPQRFLIHHTSAREISRVVKPDDDVKLYIDGNRLFVVLETFYVVCQSIEGADRYPIDQLKKFFDWEMQTTAEFHSDKLIEAFESAARIAVDVQKTKDDDLRRILFSINKDSATIKTSEKNRAGFAEYVLGVVSFTGEPRDLLMDNQYAGNLLESLKFLQSSMIVLGDKGGTTNTNISVGVKDFWGFFSSKQSNTLYGMAGIKI